MPLRRGRSKQVIGLNIAEAMRSYKSSGKIGNARPSTAQKARRMAAAMAYRTAGRSRKTS